MANLTKYGVQNRLALLENAVTELRKENADLRIHLAGELATKINDAKNVIQDSIVPAVDGKDGRDGVSVTGPQGIQGVPGDVCYVGPQGVAAAVAKVRAQLLAQRAAMIGRLVQHIADHQGSGGSQTYIRNHFERLLRDVQNDIAEQEAKAAQ